MTEKIKFLQLSELQSDKLIIEKNNNLLIDDVETLDSYSWKAIGSLLIPSILVLNATDLSMVLGARIANSNIDSSIVVYPAKGGLEVKKRTNILPDANQFEIESTRYGPQDYPSVSVPTKLKRILEQRIDKSNEPNILVVDDVIGSGRTLGAIAQTLSGIVSDKNAQPVSDEEYYSRFTNNSRSYGMPTYSAASWLIYRSTNNSSFGNRIVQPFTYALEYQGKEGKAAVNSMSTLLRPGEKEDNIRNAYAKKYSVDAIGFIGLLKELGGF